MGRQKTMKNTLRMKKLATAVVLVLGSIGAAQAAQYITNGTFSDPSTTSNTQTGWTVSPLSGHAYFFSNNAYHEGMVGGEGLLQQTITDVVGPLTLSFDFSSNSGYQNTFFDSTLVSSISAPTSLTHYSIGVTGTGTDTLQFYGRNDPNYNTLMNVSLTGTVPEPETYAMLLAGLGLIGFISYRRKNDSSNMPMAV
jgi:hypothetical protein